MAIHANEAIRIDITTKYDWFFGHNSASRHFDMRPFGGRLILVPDVEPRELGLGHFDAAIDEANRRLPLPARRRRRPRARHLPNVDLTGSKARTFKSFAMSFLHAKTVFVLARSQCQSAELKLMRVSDRHRVAATPAARGACA